MDMMRITSAAYLGSDDILGQQFRRQALRVLTASRSAVGRDIMKGSVITEENIGSKFCFNG
jgi:hypothetical protein